MTKQTISSLVLLFCFIFSTGNVFAVENSVDKSAEELQLIVPNNDKSEKSDQQTKDATIPAVDNADAEKSILTKSEKEISVNLETAKKADTDSNSIFKFILTVSMLGVMAAGGYFLLQKKTRTAGAQKQATQIKVLSQHYLGPKKSLAIVRVAGESVLIGITDQNISMIKSLSLLDEDIPEDSPNSFSPVLSKHLNKNPGFKENMIAANAANEASEDDFSVAGIKDFVSSKLKNMRTLE